ncbi:haloalkane dehalogenase [Cryptosporangium arvum]|uniref:haloalkane dehalogenase n=1 Tax=Cryptosporangium arvum TaxID=80871 RepID=UPI0004B36C44|nr:haloalkane dehalogenase [Cryptosporangium arvum]
MTHDLHAVSRGTGPAVLFLHGNPTSSYLWRNVLEPVAAAGFRCVAVDLVGMGRSPRPDLEYRFADHARYVEAFAGELGPATLVGHDWGAVLAIDLLGRRPDLVNAVAFLEGHLHPVARLDPLFEEARSPGRGEQLVLEENVFVETVLPGGVLRTLTDAERDAYRAPYPDPASRRPLLAWAREIPVEGVPGDVTAVVRANQRVLAESPAPKLLLHGEPGAVIGAAEVAWCRAHGRRLSVVSVGPGTHFLPEDHPDAIATALIDWLPRPGSRTDRGR